MPVPRGAARRASISRALDPLCVVLLVACERPPPNPVVATTPTQTLPATGDEAAATPADAPPSTGADAGSDAASAVRPSSNAETFACGSASCKSGSETCCAAGREGVCLASIPDDGPQGSIGYLKSQWEACSQVKFERSSAFDRIDRCDESIDCGKTKICCDQFLFSGGSFGECTAANKAGQTPCDFGERCLEGSPCRLAGTACVRGYCRKSGIKPNCGDSACPSDKPACCGDPPACVAEAACDDRYRVACRRHADCVSGERCIADGRSTYCVRTTPDPAQAPYVCERAADCPNKCRAGKKPRCEPSLIGFVKSCTCPD